jgi:predicted DNA-binding transcriptional regulator
MEKLKKAAENKTQEHDEFFRKILDLPEKYSDDDLITRILSIDGLNTLLSSLSEREIRVFSLLIANEEGLTFSEFEKELKIPVPDIEQIIDLLKDKLLVYVFKNRKHLNNRFDKTYIFEPVIKTIKELQSKTLPVILKEINSSFKHLALNDNDTLSDPSGLLSLIFEEGGIISLDALKEKADGRDIQEELFELSQKGELFIYFFFSYPYHTLILLKGKIIKLFCREKNLKAEPAIINNGYSSVINILHLYDTVSSHGLFLTQQDHFRKTDLKRVSQNMVDMKDYAGNDLDPEDTARIIISLAYSLNMITENKTNIFLSLDEIKHNFYEPGNITEQIIQSYNQHIENENFKSPFDLPKHRCLETVYKQILKSKKEDYFTLKLNFILDEFIRDHKHTPERFIEARHYSNEFEKILFFLHFLGITYRHDNQICLNENTSSATSEDNKSVYINPDFSLIIPKDETSQKIQYLLIAFSSVIKDDVTLNVKITKDSILAAHKREMDHNIFKEVLENNTKNTIPQNMLFLINEWINQTLDISIQYGTILEANHSSFLDELDYKFPEAIIRRLSETCAIIQSEQIDDIVKIADKHKAIIKIETVKGGTSPE